MAGYGLKKFARELGLEVHNGVICGIYEGYAVSMWEGMATKSLCISAKFDALFESEAWIDLYNQLYDLDWSYYKIHCPYLDLSHLKIVFLDKVGTMRRLREFFFLLIEILDEYNLPDVDICPQCGLPMYGHGTWSQLKVQLDVFCIYAHDNCAEAIGHKMKEENRKEEEEMHRYTAERKDRGWMGALGVGILLAAVEAVLAVLIGRSACAFTVLFHRPIEAVYERLNGSQGVKKIVTVMGVTIISGLLGGLLAYVKLNADDVLRLMLGGVFFSFYGFGGIFVIDIPEVVCQNRYQRKRLK